MVHTFSAEKRIFTQGFDSIDDGRISYGTDVSFHPISAGVVIGEEIPGSIFPSSIAAAPPRETAAKRGKQKNVLDNGSTLYTLPRSPYPIVRLCIFFHHHHDLFLFPTPTPPAPGPTTFEPAATDPHQFSIQNRFLRTGIRSPAKGSARSTSASCPPTTPSSAAPSVDDRGSRPATRAEAVGSLWRSALTGAGAAAVGARALLASSQPASGEATTTTATTTAPGGGGGGGGPEEAVLPRPSSAAEGLERIPWQEDGYLSWEYDGHKINYVDEGDKDKVKAGRRNLTLSYRAFVATAVGKKPSGCTDCTVT